ncbi:xylan glycosyltransferase MUCI21-like [Amaranthus tricolor]|uniref:xylan glycosyltransferase MUCI21-like n=1 Tax=Amaranthus tricolor TaxID=29722 RepID=UPI00258F6ED0|nr:xylan glycosyltransferase MUCI21-like [Amaranthus tricolor]
MMIYGVCNGAKKFRFSIAMAMAILYVMLLTLSIVYFASFLIFNVSSSSISMPPSSSTFQDNQVYQKEKQLSQQTSTPHIQSTISCDRSHYHYDLCSINCPTVLDSKTSTFYAIGPTSPRQFMQKIRPYPRKWENFTMSNINQVTILSGPKAPLCDVTHNTSALLFSAGGYTGNFFHDFNEGFLALFITVQLMSLTNQDVNLVIQEAHDWWVSKYKNLLGAFSNYPIIILDDQKINHCFKSAILGLVSHGFMTIDPKLMPRPTTLIDFHFFLDKAYNKAQWSILSSSSYPIYPVRKGYNQNCQTMPLSEKIAAKTTFDSKKTCNKTQYSIPPYNLDQPKLILLSRANGSGRVMLNQIEIIIMAENLGFNVTVFEPKPETPLSEAYGLMKETHVLLGIHGAALTHLLFLRPESIFIQVVPIGTDDVAEMCYGRPAKEMGLQYLEYKISIEESSLVEKYDKLDPILHDPMSQKNGWVFLKKVYLKQQNVRLNLIRFRKYLKYAYKKAKIFMYKVG